MPLKKYLFTVMSFSFFFTFSQLDWVDLNVPISNFSQRFDDIYFINDSTGWAVEGAFAKVYKTTDGGITWVKKISETDLGGDYYFRNIKFIDANIGFLGTLNGQFFKTTDGGDNWSQVTITPNPPAICGMDVVGTTVYGCGAYFEPAHLIKSTDSGLTWQYTDMSAYATALVELLFITETHGYASGKNSNGGTILETFDGGTTWTEVYNTNTPGEYIWKLNTLPTNNSYLFGAVEGVGVIKGKLLISPDSGVNWISKEAPETSIQAVGFISPTKGWMGGHTTGFFETTDAGDTWTDIGLGGNLNRIFIMSNELAYASGTSLYKFSDQTLDVNEYDFNHKRKPLEITLDKNPIGNELNISINFTQTNNILIELYTIGGKLINKLKRDIILNSGTKSYKFDFPYASGTYLISFHTNTGRQSLQIIKK